MLRKDDPAFKKVVDDAMVAVYKCGEINKIYDKWFLKPIPPKGINLNVPMGAAFKKVVAKPTDSGDPQRLPVACQKTLDFAARPQKPRRNCVRGRACDELQLELGNLFPACAGRHPYLRAASVVRRRLDIGHGPARLGDRAFVGAVVGMLRTTPVPWLVRLGNAYVELFRNIPASGADVPVVLRAAGSHAAGDRRLAQADRPTPRSTTR